MENTQTQKTPEQWFQKLKEPYRSQAIANIDNELRERYYESPKQALDVSFSWNESPQGEDQWVEISRSLEKGETTYLEPENVSLINEVNNSQVTEQQNQKWSEKIDEIIDTHVVQKLKHEPIELRPEDLVSGEVYVTKDCDNKWIFKFNRLGDKTVIHDECLEEFYFTKFNKGYFLKSDKFYHATPEEKKLLLGEKQTDLEAKYNELKSRYETLVTEAHKLDVLSGEMCDKYNELKDEYKRLSDYDEELEKVTKEQSKLIETLRNELKEKESKEKLYFYVNKEGQFQKDNKMDNAIDKCMDRSPIYEAVCIGKKKSVLVSE